jgi:dTDP-4-dehydrorhamnose 3,5-epimerase
MKIRSTSLKGAFIINITQKFDKRGFFLKLFNSKKLLKNKIEHKFVEINYSSSYKKNTLRGMHYQVPPFAETKIIKCIKGEIFDVILDLRINSPTFGKWHGEYLNDKNNKMMYVPKGFAHGFLTIKNNTEVLYFVSSPYSKKHEKGLKYNEKKFLIKWPFKISIISKKDNNWPEFNYKWHGINKFKL